MAGIAITRTDLSSEALRDWVHHSNAEGLENLSDRKAPGRAAKLTLEQEQQLAALVEAKPDLDTDGVVRWRRVDLQARINELFAVEISHLRRRICTN